MEISKYLDKQNEKDSTFGQKLMHSNLNLINITKQSAALLITITIVTAGIAYLYNQSMYLAAICAQIMLLIILLRLKKCTRTACDTYWEMTGGELGKDWMMYTFPTLVPCKAKDERIYQQVTIRCEREEKILIIKHSIENKLMETAILKPDQDGNAHYGYFPEPKENGIIRHQIVKII